MLFQTGDEIKFGSPVRFECAKAKQEAVKLRMHLPANNKGDNPSLCCELSSKSTVVRIRLFASYSATDSHSTGNLLKGGDFVRFYHQEDGAMLEIARFDLKFCLT